LGDKVTGKALPTLPELVVPSADDAFYIVDSPGGNSPLGKKITAANLYADIEDVINHSPWIDVRTYGAVGDGLTDDAADIQDAIDAAETAGSGRIYFPAGTYLIGSGLVVTKSHVTLEGAGKGITTIQTADTFTTGVAISFTSLIEPHNSDPQHHAGLSNMSLISGTDSNQNTVIGLWIEDFHSSEFSSLHIEDFNQGIKCGCYLNSFYDVKIYGTDNSTGLGNIGWEFYGTLTTGPYPAQIVMVNCTVFYYATGFKLADCNTIQTVIFDIEQCTLGVSIGPNVHNITLDGYWESCTKFIDIAGTDNLQANMAENIIISGFWNPLLAAQGHLTTITGASLAYCRYVTFRNLYIRTSYNITGTIIDVGDGVEELSIENSREMFEQLTASNYVTSINGPLSRANQVINGNFKLWSLGPSVPPDGWYIDSTATTTVAQITNDLRDGDYVAEVTGTAATDFMWAYVTIPKAYQKPGVTATLVYDVQLRDSTKARIKLSPTNDTGILKGTEMSRGISNIVGSSYPVVPANTWITRSSRPCIIGTDATQLRVRFYPDELGTGAKARLARVAVYFGSTGWAYEQSPFDTRSPVHADMTQKTYSEAGTSTTELGTWLMDRRTLKFGSWALRIRAAGTITGTNGAKIVGIKITGTDSGANVIAHIDFLAAETDTWYIDITGYRKTAALLACFVKTQKGTALIDVPYAEVGTPNFETQSNTISVYGTLAHANDTITKEMFVVEMV
jgi:hypothetical protein